jgi:hypothetical protein
MMPKELMMKLGKALQSHYHNFTRENLPDQFLDLLEEIDASEASEQKAE